MYLQADEAWTNSESIKAFLFLRQQFMVKVKCKGLSTFYRAAYMRRLVNSSALRTWKWQLIGMS